MSARSREIPVRLDGLQLAERPRLQSVIWSLQRFIWFLCLFLMLVALLGLTGRGGRWAEQRLHSESGVVKLPRVMRRLSSDLMTVRFTEPAPTHSLGLSDAFLKAFEVQGITPRPSQEQSLPGGALFHIPAVGAGPHVVTLTLRARDTRRIKTALTLDGVTLPLSLTVLP